MNELIQEGKASLALPLPGFGQELSSGVQGSIEEEVLEQEGIRPEDFRVSTMPELASPGGLRPALSHVVFPGEPDIGGNGRGGLVLKLRFSLPRGSYATVLLRELMKPRDPLSAGF